MFLAIKSFRVNSKYVGKWLIYYKSLNLYPVFGLNIVFTLPTFAQ